jgi:neurofibromin 1
LFQGLGHDREVLQPGDQYSTPKTPEGTASFNLTNRILMFLNILPMSLFDGAPTDADEYNLFFEDNFAPFISCLSTDDERIRQLTSTVARKLMVDGAAVLLQRSLEFGTNSFYRNLWRST